MKNITITLTEKEARDLFDTIVEKVEQLDIDLWELQQDENADSDEVIRQTDTFYALDTLERQLRKGIWHR